MDQSRPRLSSLKSPLIERFDLQSPKQRAIYGALTLAFWALWVYLWVPVLALLAWALGAQQAYKYMVVLGGYREVIRVAGMYTVVILVLGGGLVLWAFYSMYRFRGVDRRSAGAPVTSAQFGQDFGQDPDSVEQWQTEQRLYVTHDAKGRIARVQILAVGESIPVQRAAEMPGIETGKHIGHHEEVPVER